MSRSVCRSFGWNAAVSGAVLCCALAAGTAHSASPLGDLQPTGFVNDFVDAIRPDTQSELERVLRDLERRTGAEIAVVTVDSVPDGDIERAAVDLVERWGIGKRGKDNGVLILCAVKDRRVRIEVGYELEGILPDGRTGQIIDEHMLPRFRAGDMSAGLQDGTLAVARVIAADAGVTLGEHASPRSTHRPPSTASTLVLLLFLVVMAILFIRNPRLFLLAMSMPGGRGYGYRRGRFGGDFGGFGGGLSGGGGATRGW
jgi:uncharacterized protein